MNIRHTCAQEIAKPTHIHTHPHIAELQVTSEENRIIAIADVRHEALTCAMCGGRVGEFPGNSHPMDERMRVGRQRCQSFRLEIMN